MFDLFRPFRRRKPAGWRLIDPRPRMAENPYTFFVPSPAQIAALEPGDLVKMMFEGFDPVDPPIERMWVIFDGRDDEGCYGRLDNDPYMIEGLAPEDEIRFQDYHVTSIWETRVQDDEADAFEERMFSRARVDTRVLDGSAAIGRIERHQRRDVEGIDFPDTGWHIQARGHPPVAGDALQFVAIGVVLNLDDALLPHLDAPVGAAFEPGPDGGFHPA